MRFALTRDRGDLGTFFRADLPVTGLQRLTLLRRCWSITQAVRGYHTEGEILQVGAAILRRTGSAPHVVEAGCAYGSSTAKLSHFVDRAGGTLTVLDSFRGIPSNDELHRTLDGRPVHFRKGAFRGRLTSVRRTIDRLGVLDVCHLVKGDFEETAIQVPGPIHVLLLDVDLLRSTRVCLEALYPKLAPGADVFSQDGHLQATVDLLASESFWRSLQVPAPHIPGLGRQKFLHWVAQPPSLGRPTVSGPS